MYELLPPLFRTIYFPTVPLSVKLLATVLNLLPHFSYYSFYFNTFIYILSLNFRHI